MVFRCDNAAYDIAFRGCDIEWRDKVVYIRMLIVEEAEGEKRENETEETAIRAAIRHTVLRPINTRVGCLDVISLVKNQCLAFFL